MRATMERCLYGFTTFSSLIATVFVVSSCATAPAPINFCIPETQTSNPHVNLYATAIKCRAGYLNGTYDEFHTYALYALTIGSDKAKITFADRGGRDFLSRYTLAPGHKAFAVSTWEPQRMGFPPIAHTWASITERRTRDEAVKEALGYCESIKKSPDSRCEIYAIDESIVWNNPLGAPKIERTPPAKKGRQLSGNEILSTYSGTTMKALATENYPLLISDVIVEYGVIKSGSKGRMVGQTESGRLDQGFWWVKNDKICRQWNMWSRGGTNCFKIRLDGEFLIWMENDESLYAIHRITSLTIKGRASTARARYSPNTSFEIGILAKIEAAKSEPARKNQKGRPLANKTNKDLCYGLKFGHPDYDEEAKRRGLTKDSCLKKVATGAAATTTPTATSPAFKNQQH